MSDAPSSAHILYRISPLPPPLSFPPFPHLLQSVQQLSLDGLLQPRCSKGLLLTVLIPLLALLVNTDQLGGDLHGQLTHPRQVLVYFSESLLVTVDHVLGPVGQLLVQGLQCLLVVARELLGCDAMWRCT